MNYYTILPALPLLAGLLFFEKKESAKGISVFKPLLSLLFIITALVQAHHSMPYFYIILSGLLLCLVGDICLIFFFNKKIFTAGLAAFLAGHIMYTIAFFKFGESGNVILQAGAVYISFSLLVFILLKPHLGSMTGSVCAYITIITLMALSSVAFWNNETHNHTARILIPAAALIFYISDIFVSRHRFVKKEFLNRAIGLPMYYTAQFMIALSTGFI